MDARTPSLLMRMHAAAARIVWLMMAGLAIDPAIGQSGPAWTAWGPAPIGNVEYTGRVSAIVCSPTDANRFFVAGADGGVWRTSDGGASWTSLTDAMPTTAIGALALDPSDEDVIYAGTGEANFAYHSRFGLGIYKSVDGGDTWAHLSESAFAGRCISKLVVSPADSATLFAGVTSAGGFIPPADAAKGHPQADGPVGIFKSTDGGQTWTQLTNGLPNLAGTDVILQPDDPQIIYAGIGHIFGHDDNGTYNSVDGGTSWSKLAGGLPTSDVGRISLAAAPSMPQRVYAAIVQAADANGGSAALRGVYRTDNGGASWTLTSASNYMASYGWYLNVVSVRPDQPDTVFVGGLSLLRSTNAGSSYVDVTPPHVDIHALAWDAAGRLVVGDDGGVHRTANLGSAWSPLNDGLGIIQFYAGLSTDPVDAELLYGGTQDNGTNKRHSNGIWTLILGADGGVTAVDPNSPNIVFAEAQGTGNLYRSTAGGAGMVLSNAGIVGTDRNCFLPPYEIDPNNSSRLVYGTHRVYRSLNGGLSWSPISSDLTATPTGAIHSLAIAPSNPATIWVTTNDGHVQVSFNDGAEWQLVRTGLPGWFRTMRQVFVAPDDHLTTYLAASRFGVDQVLRTTDGGQSWSALDGDLPDQPVNVVAVDVRPAVDVLYAGAEDGVYRSTNGGANWHRYGSGLPNTAVIDLRVDLARSRLIAGTQGRGAWRISIWLPGDLDANGTVDLDDHALFVGCFAGPAAAPAPLPPTSETDCLGAFDNDFDSDVDLADHAYLLASFTGP